jgi:hypothetical protein
MCFLCGGGGTKMAQDGVSSDEGVIVGEIHGEVEGDKAVQRDRLVDVRVDAVARVECEG